MGGVVFYHAYCMTKCCDVVLSASTAMQGTWLAALHWQFSHSDHVAGDLKEAGGGLEPAPVIQLHNVVWMYDM